MKKILRPSIQKRDSERVRAEESWGEKVWTNWLWDFKDSQGKVGHGNTDTRNIRKLLMESVLGTQRAEMKALTSGMTLKTVWRRQWGCCNFSFMCKLEIMKVPGREQLCLGQKGSLSACFSCSSGMLLLKESCKRSFPQGQVTSLKSCSSSQQYLMFLQGVVLEKHLTRDF